MAPRAALAVSGARVALVSFDDVGAVRSHQLKLRDVNSKCHTAAEAEPTRTMETMLARHNISLSAASYYYTCSAVVPGADCVVVGTSEGDVCRFDMSQTWDRATKVAKMKQAKKKKKRQKKMMSPAHEQRRRQSSSGGGTGGETPRMGSGGDGERDWYVTSVAIVRGGRAGLLEVDEAETSGLNIMKSKSKRRRTARSRKGGTSSSSSSSSSPSGGEGRFVVATLVSHRTVAVPAPSSSSLSTQTSTRVFHEASCKIRVWDVYSQIAIREICLQPSHPAPHVSPRWWTGVRLPDIRLCVTSGFHGTAGNNGSLSSHVDVVMAGEAADIGTAPVLHGHPLNGKSIELLRSRGRRKSGGRGGHSSSHLRVASSSRPINWDNSRVIGDVRQVTGKGHGEAEDDNEDAAVYEYLLMRDGADKPCWTFLVDAREEHLMGELALRISQLVPEKFATAEAVLIELFRTIDDGDSSGSISSSNSNISVSSATKRNRDAGREVLAASPQSQQILVTNARVMFIDDDEDEDAVAGDDGAGISAKDDDAGTLCILDAEAVVSGHAVLEAQVLTAGFCKSRLTMVHQELRRSGRPRTVVCDSDGGIFVQDSVAGEGGGGGSEGGGGGVQVVWKELVSATTDDSRRRSARRGVRPDPALLAFWPARTERMQAVLVRDHGSGEVVIADL